ncbi:MAG: SAM-dependent chlorinase/fluorinase [Bacteroidia bacterium]|nr:SAM-dependent chlorinase/fluorinase [Bacteroidia bacterium]
MPIVTLTTDLGLKDPYVAALKGSILSALPDCIIVDISHQVGKHDEGQAGFILRSAYRYFPVGTIHINAVSKDISNTAIYIGIKHKGHYFIGPDNGVFSLVLDDKPEEIIQLDSVINFSSHSFPCLDILVPAACKLVKTGSLSSLGTVKDSIQKQLFFNPVLEEKRITGAVIYIDGFGNIFTNITKDSFDQTFKGKGIKIVMKNLSHTISGISQVYGDVMPGEILAFFNSVGLLEIAQNCGSASKYLGLKMSDKIWIEANDNKGSKNDFQTW